MKALINKYLIICILAHLHISTFITAQSPNSFKYQAVLRDASGNTRANASVNIRIDLLQGTATGTNVFAETFAAQTNAFGLVNLEIGNGTLVSGSISGIDWSAGPYFIKISVDGAEIGTSQLLSVPYAKYAEKAGNEQWTLNGQNTYYNKGRVGIGSDVPSARLHVADSAVVFTGPVTLPTVKAAPPIQGVGSRMMWYPDKAAFRVGLINGTANSWNKDSIGSYSFAAGFNTKAKGIASVAIGNYTTALGRGSVACGDNCIAAGAGSTAFGYGIATGDYSVAMGNSNTASGLGSMSFGRYSVAAGELSTCIGLGTSGMSYLSLNIGQYNAYSGTKDLWVATDQLFVAGNGTSNNHSNAMVLYKNGNMTIAGTLTQNSDIRLKENISPLANTLGKINNIQPVYYEFKDKRAHPAGKHIGFIAQEIQKEFPELVSTDENGYLSVEYQNMTSVLLQALKEQQKQIDELKQQVEKLTNK